jgi:hypothetical protein
MLQFQHVLADLEQRLNPDRVGRFAGLLLGYTHLRAELS